MSDGRVQLRILGGVELSGPDGTPARAVLSQPKRLALLFYLAAANPRGFHRRDTLLALFWPESPGERARMALNRAVYFLRHSLDRRLIVNRGDEELAVAEERLWCDVAAFEQALDAGRPSEALELYRGDLAPGFFVDGLSEFERWMQSERGRLRDRAREAALGLADAEETRGELPMAEHWAHRAMMLAPHDERAAQRRMELLDRVGDRAGALEAYEGFAARLSEDLGVEPSPETQALQATIRGRRAPVRPPGTFPSRGASRDVVTLLPAEPPAAPPPPGRPFRLWHIWSLGGALVAGGALALALLRDRPAATTLGRRAAVAVAPEIERWPSLSPDGGTVFYTVSFPGSDELFAQQLDGGSPVPLTSQVPGAQRYGVLSPGGTQLLFLGDDGLYVMAALGGEARRVVAGEVSFRRGLFWGGWAPDGQRIVYIDRDTLIIHHLQNGNRTALATGANIHSPAWSPDGQWIAYVEGNPAFHVNGNTGPSALRVVAASGGLAVPITDASTLNTSPIWVPGRRGLLFISDREGGRDIYEIVLNEDGSPRGAPVRVTTGLNPERISISADGRRLAWSLYTEVTNLWALETTKGDSVPLGTARQITAETQKIEAAASISPDGAWLYYDSDRGGNADVWRLPVAGGQPQRLTADPAGDFYPAVSPDGREVAFHSLRSGNRDIYVMPAAGGSPVQISTSPQDEAVPAWSPDGRALIWQSTDTIRITRRRKDGSWGKPVPLYSVPGGGALQWSPDGRWISLASSRGFELLDPIALELNPLPGAAGIFWHTWSGDSRTIFGAMTDRTGRMVILAVPIAGGRPRLLAYADDPMRQVYDRGLVVSGGRFYFPLVERKADVWVGELGRW